MIHSGNLLKCCAQQASPVFNDIYIMSILLQHILKHAVVAELFVRFSCGENHRKLTNIIRTPMPHTFFAYKESSRCCRKFKQFGNSWFVCKKTIS